MLTIPTIAGWRNSVRAERSWAVFPWRNTARNNQPILISRMQAMAQDRRRERHRQRSERRQPTADSAFQLGWFQHLTNRWGRATNGRAALLRHGQRAEHLVLNHRDVHPTGPTMEEIRNAIIDYGAKAKSVDPDAQVVGPEEWGWSGYLYSGYDQQYGSSHGLEFAARPHATGNMDYLPWLLDQLRRTNIATGQRILDVFTVHYKVLSGTTTVLLSVTNFSARCAQAWQLTSANTLSRLADLNYSGGTL